MAAEGVAAEPRRSRSSMFVPPEAMMEAMKLDGGEESDEEETNGSPETSMVSSPDGSPQGLPDSKQHSSSSVDEEFTEVEFAYVLPDNYIDKKNFKDGQIKPCRPVPMIKASDLVNGLKKTSDGNYMFEGPLNGWPGLTRLEMKSITRKVNIMGTKIGMRIDRVWDAKKDKDFPDPSKIDKKGHRVNFRAQGWTDHGWSPESLGFVYWWSMYKGKDQMECLFGDKMLDELDAGAHAKATVTNLFCLAHRYPVEEAKATFRDKNTWHTAVILEWSHEKFITVCELAWLNGCGGYGGKANWVRDKLESSTELFRKMHDGMKQPWDNKRSEIRTYDMPLKNKEEFLKYLAEYEQGNKGVDFAQARFLKPEIYKEGKCRIRRCTASVLAGHLLNYIERAKVYDELKANCQTFATDLFAFLAGDKGCTPYGSIVKPQYKQRSHAFMYLPKYD